MHEQTYVTAIIEEANRHGAVTAVTVEVGDLAPIPAAELGEALRTKTGWDVTLTTRPGLVECPCGTRAEPIVTDKGHDFTIFRCRTCGRDMPRIVDGQDIILKDVTVE